MNQTKAMQRKQKEPQICVESQHDFKCVEQGTDVTYEEHLRLKVCVSFSFVDHVRCSIRERKVKQPIRRCCHGQSLGSDFQREQLAGDDPGDRTPGAGEEEDVEAYESDGDFLCGLVVGAGDGSGDGDDVLADAHADCAHEEEVAAAHLLDEVEAREGGDYVDAAAECQSCLYDIL
jgi:hypothetical protein